MAAVVLLSPGGRFCEDLLAELARRGTPVDAVLIYPPTPRGWRAARLLAPLRWLVRRARALLRPLPRGGARRLVRTGPLNGPRMARALRRLGPDRVVLAHCGLVAPALLEIPGEGVVSVHPALLPWVRGNSPVANSLLRGIPLGATAFRVDAGIDTGRILARRLLEVRGGESTAELKAALHRLWVEMTADLATAPALGEGWTQAGRFPLARTLPAPAADEPVRRGVHRDLFERWRPACGPGLDLGPDAVTPP